MLIDNVNRLGPALPGLRQSRHFVSPDPPQNYRVANASFSRTSRLTRSINWVSRAISRS
jgi:hypothetical protein